MRSLGKKLTLSTWNASLAQRQALSRDGSGNSGDQLCVRELLSGKRTPQASTPRSRACRPSHWLRKSFIRLASPRGFRGEVAAAHEQRAVGIDVRDNPVPGSLHFQTLKRADGQTLSQLPRFLGEELQKTNSRVCVRALPLIEHITLCGTDQHFVNFRSQCIQRSRCN